MQWSESERAALVMSMRQLDPDAPTLCEGWNVRRLVAHLVQREHAPLQQLGDSVRKDPAGQEKNLNKLVASAATPVGYQKLVDTFAAGTGMLNPMSWLGDTGQLLEYVVHHEDLLRGAGESSRQERPAAALNKLFSQLRLMGKLIFRRSPVGVAFAHPDENRPAVIKRGEGVTITGDPVELALYVSGRRDAAQIQLDGAPEHVAAFQQWLDA